MLPKNHRLNKETEIKKLVKTGRTFLLPQFIIRYQINKEATTKVGFVISTKVDKRASVRNLLKRRLREAVKELFPNLKLGYSVLIIAKKRALELDFQQIKKQLLFAFSQIKIYNKSQGDK
ncbi:MAG: ribonuclease P protein component [Candidatus Komeilibacteria bacterium CG11_big_fil_rev_8_21_14_0_20_36_20]|uniref:Ribonuclease P protein component n=1 Tax=Candidatus Komeilibacteria bacterium CG11_big_fil_rev_8_21_14_0_20_36_20 TaxID=1974477 RepID=A0A2H0NCG7_9BACT|nr:MAG: ribonuclease P protein component [Candidatus Komeilibacteria bacterium CG11_big_fil_rev_8_21_14_0_20_36_20]PIR81916.1 MAG: ribonuclease P protein component [Candidatus Komeilibacteria bacterium CG10_big_fil_rev_8_21_14_0_10_36_65]PJC55357.1 MAG: ribonuclease P protein component [Candidatus Komeilibacteria bacterium CG_4_9_14_0_2_um_filter_36_13]